MRRARILRDFFQVPLFGDDEPAHVAREEQWIGDPSEWRLPVQDVAHERPAGARVKLVNVAQAPEGSADLLVYKYTPWIDFHDFRGEALADSEMTAFEGHEVTELQQTGQASRFDD